MIIELETTFTPYTLDTYNVFNMDSGVEMHIENMQENSKDSIDYDLLDWEYDMQGYTKGLSENLIKLLKDNILDDVILGVSSDMKVLSPKFYNFDTDKIFIDFDVNFKKLQEYINTNSELYNKNKLKSCDGFMWLGDDTHTMLNFYLENKTKAGYNEYEYMMDQNEQIEAYEYIACKLIDKV